MESYYTTRGPYAIGRVTPAEAAAMPTGVLDGGVKG